MSAPLSTDELLRAQQRIADQDAVATVETNCIDVRQPHDRTHWYDTRTMLDPREFAPEVLDMHLVRLQYALTRGLVTPHPDVPHMVRITPKGRSTC